jgi:Plasma-membrane choline transporter
MKDRGWDAVVNDILIDNVLTMGSVMIAYITAFLSYLYLEYTAPAYNASGGFNAPVIAFGFLIGLQMVFSPCFKLIEGKYSSCTY